MDLKDKSIFQLIKLLDLNEISNENIIKDCVNNIEKENLDNELFQSFLKDYAINKAKEIDRRRNNKEKLGFFSGLPIIVTDDISTKGILTTCGSKILENYIPPFNATVIERLLKEDCIIIGKARVKEFSLKASDNICKALDSGGGTFALSTSQNPKKFTMKATFGLISRYGMIGGRSTFDQIVPITKTLEDMAIVLNTLVQYDKKDSGSIKLNNIDYSNCLNTHIKERKIAVSTDLSNISNGSRIANLASRLENDGFIIEEVSLSSLEYIEPVYKILSSAEFASNLAKYDGISFGHRTSQYADIDELYKKTRSQGFTKETKESILFGNYLLSSNQHEKYYVKAQKIRSIIKEEFTKITNEYSAILLPFVSGDKWEPYNLIGNMTGLPSLTIPDGIQLIGPVLSEDSLLKIAYVCNGLGGGDND